MDGKVRRWFIRKSTEVHLEKGLCLSKGYMAPKGYGHVFLPALINDEKNFSFDNLGSHIPVLWGFLCLFSSKNILKHYYQTLEEHMTLEHTTKFWLRSIRVYLPLFPVPFNHLSILFLFSEYKLASRNPGISVVFMFCWVPLISIFFTFLS